jgi:hypothetical protein
LDFPPGRRYELVHRLRGSPTHIGAFVSFEPTALATGNNIAQAAGNQAVIERADESVVWVRNDTCADLFLRVEISTAAPELDASAGDAGGD